MELKLGKKCPPDLSDSSNIYRKDLSFSVDTDDAIGRLVGRGNKDGLSADPVHVDAGAALQVVKVNVTVLRDEINDAMLLTDL